MQDDDDGDLQAGVTADDLYTPEGPPKDGKLKRPLLPHEYSDNTPVPKKRNRKNTSTVWQKNIKRLRKEALLGPILKVGQDSPSQVFCIACMLNRDFMEYMRTYYPEVIKSGHPQYGTVINADDVRQQREKEDAETEPDLFRG